MTAPRSVHEAVVHGSAVSAVLLTVKVAACALAGMANPATIAIANADARRIPSSSVIHP